MDEQKKITIRNIGSIDVIVTIGQTDPSHIELPTDTSAVVKGSDSFTLNISFDGGCAKMYVWSISKKLLWCGIIPLMNDISNPLILDSNNLKVSYAGLDIPKCPEKRSVGREYFGRPREDGIDFVKVIIILAVVIGLYGIIQMIWG